MDMALRVAQPGRTGRFDGDDGVAAPPAAAAHSPEPAGHLRADYHWSPACRRAFLEELACTGSVLAATRAVGKSRRAAYLLRCRRDGEAFRIGWDAAVLLAQAAVADALMDRALHGYTEIITPTGDGGATRERLDNRLSFRLLGRLDRMVDAQPASGSYAQQVQLAAQDFEAFLDLIDAPPPEEQAAHPDSASGAAHDAAAVDAALAATAAPAGPPLARALDDWFADRIAAARAGHGLSASERELARISAESERDKLRARDAAFAPVKEWFDWLRNRIADEAPETELQHQSIAVLVAAMREPDFPIALTEDEILDKQIRLAQCDMVWRTTGAPLILPPATPSPHRGPPTPAG